MLARYVTALVVLGAALPAPALEIRPDRDDEEYVELATKYASAVQLGTGGGGVLIGSNWVLTSAQAARAMAEQRDKAFVRVAGQDYRVREAVPHERWQRPGGPHDVGLLLLRDAPKGIAPTAVNRHPIEAGKAIVLVGFDGKRRASVNTVDHVEAEILETRIKGKDEASDLQGVLTPRDLPAPVYLDGPDGLFVAGIAFAADGRAERISRASAHFRWIEDTMLEVNTREAASLLGNQTE